MRIIAFDIGDVHTGVAYSDDLGIIAAPYTSVATNILVSWLTHLLTTEPIETIVVGYPKTLRGTHSAQTEKVIAFVEMLKKQFPTITWKLIDERLTSKQAQIYLRTKSKKHKNSEHSIAAAIVLQTYLDALTISRTNNS